MKRKIIILLVIVSMILPILPIEAFATQSEFDTPLYVSLGDSMTNGLGLSGYDMADGTVVNGFLQEANDAYPTLLANENGWDLTQLATSAFRAEDAYALLTYESSNSGAVEFDSSTWSITGPVGTSAIDFDGYFAEAVVGRCEDYDGGVGFTSGVSSFNGTTYYDGVAWVADQYQYAVDNADVVSLALGGNNFGTFLSMTLLNQLNVQFGLDMGGLDYGITEEALANRIAELDPEHAALATQLRNELEASLKVNNSAPSAIDLPTNIDDFINTMALYGTYSFVGFILGYQGVLDYIEENNSDADIIILGLNNTLHDIKIDLTGDDVAIIHCGKFFDCIYNAANMCSESLSKKYTELNIYYTKAANEDLEIIYTALAPDEYGEVDWTNYEIAKSRFTNSMRNEINAIKVQSGAYAPFMSDETALEKLLTMAHTVDAIDVPALIAYLTGNTEDQSLYDEGMKNSLYLAFRFTAASGIGCHPSIEGHKAMKSAISNVYSGIWTLPADTSASQDIALKLEEGNLYVSYDGGETWTLLGNVQGSNGSNGQDGTDGRDGENGIDGKTPSFKLENGELMVSYDDGFSWNSLGNVQGLNGNDGQNGSDGQNGADGKTPTFKIEDGELKVSYDGLNWNSLGVIQGSNGNNGQNGSDGQDGQNGLDGKTPAFKIEDGELKVSYDNGETWSSLGVIQGSNGSNGQNGSDGQDGQNGIDGKTPLFKIESGELMISYDDGTSWTSLGIIQGSDGYNGQDGSDGQNGTNGQDGEDGKDAIAPRIRINYETNEWEISYDNGKVWTSLGVKATGDKGEPGEAGVPGENGQDGKDGLTIAATAIGGTALASNIGFIVCEILRRKKKLL